MPGMDGRAFCRALQAEPAYGSIPVVLMSAAAAPTAREGYTYAAFLRKPFDIETLTSTITTVLNGNPDGYRDAR